MGSKPMKRSLIVVMLQVALGVLLLLAEPAMSTSLPSGDDIKHGAMKAGCHLVLGKERCTDWFFPTPSPTPAPTMRPTPDPTSAPTPTVAPTPCTGYCLSGGETAGVVVACSAVILAIAGVAFWYFRIRDPLADLYTNINHYNSKEETEMAHSAR